MASTRAERPPASIHVPSRRICVFASVIEYVRVVVVELVPVVVVVLLMTSPVELSVTITCVVTR